MPRIVEDRPAGPDPDLAIRWPLPVGRMSAKDRAAGSWADLRARLGVRADQRTDALGLTW